MATAFHSGKHVAYSLTLKPFGFEHCGSIRSSLFAPVVAWVKAYYHRYHGEGSQDTEQISTTGVRAYRSYIAGLLGHGGKRTVGAQAEQRAGRMQAEKHRSALRTGLIQGSRP